MAKNNFTSAELIELAAKVESHSNHPIAQSIRQAYAPKLGLDSQIAELLPEDKVSAIEKILKQVDQGIMVAFVGDGI